MIILKLISKNIARFAIKIIILSPFDIEDSICLKNLNLNQNIPSSYQYFNTPSNKDNNQAPRYCSRSNSYLSRKFSRESRHKSRSHSRSNSRSKTYQNHSSHNHSSYDSRNRYRDDQYYRKSPSRTFSPPRSHYTSTSSSSPNYSYPRYRERSSSYNNSSCRRAIHHDIVLSKSRTNR